MRIVSVKRLMKSIELGYTHPILNYLLYAVICLAAKSWSTCEATRIFAFHICLRRHTSQPAWWWYLQKKKKTKQFLHLHIGFMGYKKFSCPNWNFIYDMNFGIFLVTNSGVPVLYTVGFLRPSLYYTHDFRPKSREW